MTGDFPPPACMLPHSYPFVLIDRIIEREEGKRIVCLKNVTFGEEFFQGHFMGNPVMPGVLIIEAMAQASGLIICEKRTASAFLARVSDARFRKAVVPGDRLFIESTLIRDFRPLYLFEVSARVQDEVAAEAEITLTVHSPDESDVLTG